MYSAVQYKCSFHFQFGLQIMAKMYKVGILGKCDYIIFLTFFIGKIIKQEIKQMVLLTIPRSKDICLENSIMEWKYLI